MTSAERRKRGKEVAAAIDQHLKRFEASTEINPQDEKGLLRYWNARSWYHYGGVYVVYISYQGESKMSLEDGELYLQWLNEGNTGRHWHAVKAMKERAAN